MQTSTPPNKAFWEAVTLVGILLAVLLLSVLHLKGWLSGSSSGNDGERAPSERHRNGRSEQAPTGTPAPSENSPSPDGRPTSPGTPPPRDEPRNRGDPPDRGPDEGRGGGPGRGPGGDFGQPINELDPGLHSTLNFGRNSATFNFPDDQTYRVIVEEGSDQNPPGYTRARPEHGHERAPPPSAAVPRTPITPAPPRANGTPVPGEILRGVPPSAMPQRTRFEYLPFELSLDEHGRPISLTDEARPSVSNIRPEDFAQPLPPEAAAAIPTSPLVVNPLWLPDTGFVKPEPLNPAFSLHTGEELAARNVGEQEAPEAIPVDGVKSPISAKPESNETEEAAALRKEAEKPKEKDKVKNTTTVEGLRRILDEAQRNAERLQKELEERQKVKQKEKKKRKAAVPEKEKSLEEIAAEKEVKALRKKLEETLAEAETARAKLIEAREEKEAASLVKEKQKGKGKGKEKGNEKGAEEAKEKEKAKRKVKSDAAEVSDAESEYEEKEVKVKDKDGKEHIAVIKQKKAKKKKAKAPGSEGEAEESDVEVEKEKRKEDLKKKIKKAKDEDKVGVVAELEARLAALEEGRGSDKPKVKKKKVKLAKDAESESEDEEVDSKDPVKPKAAKPTKKAQSEADVDVDQSDSGEEAATATKRKRRVKNAKREVEELEDSGDEVTPTPRKARRRVDAEVDDERPSTGGRDKPKASRQADVDDVNEFDDAPPSRVRNVPPERGRGQDGLRPTGGKQRQEEDLNEDHLQKPLQQALRPSARNQAVPPTPPVPMPNETPADFQQRFQRYQAEHAQYVRDQELYARGVSPGSSGGRPLEGDAVNGDASNGESRSLEDRLAKQGKDPKNGAPAEDGDDVPAEHDEDDGLTQKQRERKAEAMRLKREAEAEEMGTEDGEADLDASVQVADVNQQGAKSKKKRNDGVDAEADPFSESPDPSRAEDGITATDHENGYTLTKEEREKRARRRKTPEYVKRIREEARQEEARQEEARQKGAQSGTDFDFDGYSDDDSEDKIEKDGDAVPAPATERPLSPADPTDALLDDLTADDGARPEGLDTAAPVTQMPQAETPGESRAPTFPSPKPETSSRPERLSPRASFADVPDGPERNGSAAAAASPPSDDTPKPLPRKQLSSRADGEADATAPAVSAPLISPSQRVAELELTTEEKADDELRVKQRRARDMEARRLKKLHDMGRQKERDDGPDMTTPEKRPARELSTLSKTVRKPDADPQSTHERDVVSDKGESEQERRSREPPLPREWMTAGGGQEFDPEQTGLVRQEEEERARIQRQQEDEAGRAFVKEMEPVITKARQKFKTPLNEEDAKSAEAGMEIAKKRRRAAEAEKGKDAKESSKPDLEGVDSDADTVVDEDVQNDAQFSARDAETLLNGKSSTAAKVEQIENIVPDSTPLMAMRVGVDDVAKGDRDDQVDKAEIDVELFSQEKRAAQEQFKRSDQRRNEDADTDGSPKEDADAAVAREQASGENDNEEQKPSGQTKVDENGIPLGEKGDDFVANHGVREEGKRQKKKKKEKKEKKKKRRKGQDHDMPIEDEGPTGVPEVNPEGHGNLDGPADQESIDSSGKKRSKKQTNRGEVPANGPKEPTGTVDDSQDAVSGATTDAAADEASSGNGGGEDARGVHDPDTREEPDMKTAQDAQAGVPVSDTDTETKKQRQNEGRNEEGEASARFGHEVRNEESPSTRRQYRERPDKRPDSSSSSGHEDPAQKPDQTAEDTEISYHKDRSSVTQMAWGITRKIGRIARRSPLFSLLTLAGVLVWVLGSRQLANLVILSTGSSAVEIPDKRGLDADLEITSAVAADLLSSKSLSTIGLFFVVNAFIFVSVLITGLMLSCAVSRADATRTPNPDAWWRHPIRSTRSVLSTSFAVSTLLLSALIMGAKLHGPMTILRRATWRTYLRFGMFLLQVVITMLLIRQSMSFVYMLGTGSTTSFSDMPDVAASASAIATALEGVSPTTAFAALAMILGVTMPALALGLYALLHPRPSRSQAGKNGLRSRLKGNKTVAKMLRLVGAVVITATFVGIMYFFGEIATYATSASSSTSANLLAANAILIIFVAPLGWALITFWDCLKALGRGGEGGSGLSCAGMGCAAV